MFAGGVLQTRHNGCLQQGAFPDPGGRKQQGEFIGQDFVNQNVAVRLTPKERVLILLLVRA
jgi:hypothetical protein